MSTITIQEGFSDAIMSMMFADDAEDDVIAAAVANSDSLLVTFTGIPEGCDGDGARDGRGGDDR